MTELPNPGLSGWDNFYVIVGSSAAALIGLQFVVITLIAYTQRRSTHGSIGAFAGPTVVHLGGAQDASPSPAPTHQIRTRSDGAR